MANIEVLDLARKNKQFSYEITMSASGTYDLDFTQEGTNESNYAPFQNIVIFNTGSVPVKKFENQNTSFDYIPAGVIDEKVNKNIQRLLFQNTSSTTQATIIVIVNNDLSMIELLKEQLRRGLSK